MERRILDDRACRALEEERARHEDTLRYTPQGDADAFLREFDRHAHQVNTILREHAGRARQKHAEPPAR